MRNLSLQQKDAAAKGKLEPSSLLTFWKHTVTLVTSPPPHSQGMETAYCSPSSMPLFIPSTLPFTQCAAHGRAPSIFINKLIHISSISRRNLGVTFDWFFHFECSINLWFIFAFITLNRLRNWVKLHCVMLWTGLNIFHVFTSLGLSCSFVLMVIILTRPPWNFEACTTDKLF